MQRNSPGSCSALRLSPSAVVALHCFSSMALSCRPSELSGSAAPAPLQNPRVPASRSWRASARDWQVNARRRCASSALLRRLGRPSTSNPGPFRVNLFAMVVGGTRPTNYRRLIGSPRPRSAEWHSCHTAKPLMRGRRPGPPGRANKGLPCGPQALQWCAVTGHAAGPGPIAPASRKADPPPAGPARHTHIHATHWSSGVLRLAIYRLAEPSEPGPPDCA